MSPRLSAWSLFQDVVDEIHHEFRGQVTIESKNGTKFWKSLTKVGEYTGIIPADTITSIGPKLGVPLKLLHNPEKMYRELMIERKHLRQYSRLGFGNLWLGFAFWLLLYVCFPFPVCFCYFRAKFDKEAYKEVIRAFVLLYGKTRSTQEEAYLKNLCLTPFEGWNKVFTWPWSLNLDNWFKESYLEVLREEGLLYDSYNLYSRSE